MDGLTKLATEIGHARDYGQMASAAARKLLDIVAELDAQHMAALEEQANDIWADVAKHYVELPKDADGEVIHFGDVLNQFGTPMTVFAMSDPDPDQGDCMLELITDGISDSTWVRARKMRHYHAPTVEDVLREMLYKAHIYDEREMELLPDLIAEYAKRLTLRAEVDE